MVTKDYNKFIKKGSVDEIKRAAAQVMAESAKAHIDK
jgi:hypothetical protein